MRARFCLDCAALPLGSGFYEYLCEKEVVGAGSDLDQSCSKAFGLPSVKQAGSLACHNGREGAVLMWE